MVAGRKAANSGSAPKRGLKTVAALLEPLSHKRRELMRQVLEKPREHVLSSIRALAGELDVDPATLARTVQAMGFGTYKDFQRYLHELSVLRATPLELMTDSRAKNFGIPGHVRAALECASENLRALRHSLDFVRMAHFAKRIYEAERVLIIGGDLASALVWFLAYNLRILGLTVIAATSCGEIVHLTRTATARDVLIAISFRRGLRQTVEGLLQARQKKAYCVGITDTFVSAIARSSDLFFLTSIESPSYAGSYVSPMALLDVIMVVCAHYRSKRTVNLLKEAQREQLSGFRWYVHE